MHTHARAHTHTHTHTHTHRHRVCLFLYKCNLTWKHHLQLYKAHASHTWTDCRCGRHVWSPCLWSPSWCWTPCRPASRRKWHLSPASCRAGTSPSPPASCTHTNTTWWDSVWFNMNCSSRKWAEPEKRFIFHVYQLFDHLLCATMMIFHVKMILKKAAVLLSAKTVH